jgi:NitT/TauT family transport system permease protein
MPGARCARSRACSVESTRVSHHGHTGNTRHSPRNGLRLTPRSPRGPGSFAPVIPEKLASQELDTSVGVSGPHDFAVRFKRVRLNAVSVHRIPRSTSVTIAKRPSVGRDNSIYSCFYLAVKLNSEIQKPITVSVVAARRLGHCEDAAGSCRKKAAGQYLSNGLISICEKLEAREQRVAEPRDEGGVAKALKAAWLRPFLFLIFIVVAWDLAIRLFKIPAYQIPAPADVVAVLISDWPELLRQAWPTTYATVCGFLLSAAFGIPVAMLIAGSKTVESYVYPLLVFSQSVPKIAIAPLFVVWFGFGIIPKVISAFLLGFFPVVVSAVQGFKSVDPDMVDLARAMQGSRFHVFCAVNLPHAMPAIFSGLKVSVTLAVVGAVVGEFVGSNSGIGYVLQRSIGTFDLPTMFAALVILALLGVILFWIVDRIERLVIPWHVSQREDIIFAS